MALVRETRMECDICDSVFYYDPTGAAADDVAGAIPPGWAYITIAEGSEEWDFVECPLPNSDDNNGVTICPKCLKRVYKALKYP